MFHRVALSLLALSLVAGPALADYTNNHGSICRNVRGADAASIEYAVNGVRSAKPAGQSLMLICPLPRPEPFGNGATVFVTVSHNIDLRTECTAYNIASNGALAGFRTAVFQGVGVRELALDLTFTGDTFSDYAVMCSIGGDRLTSIYGVDLSELRPIQARGPESPVLAPGTAEQSFRSQARTTASAGVESSLRDRLAAAEPSLRDALRELSCRAETCRVELDATGTGLLDSLPVFLHQLADTLSRGVADERVLPDGSRRLVLYLSRS